MTVRDIIKRLERDGWQLERQVGSHRQYRHPSKAGTVTRRQAQRRLASGYSWKHPPPGRLEGIGQLTGYAVIIEGAGILYSAYAPDLPGCLAAGRSIDEVKRLMQRAIRLHIESLRAHGEPGA